MSEPEPFDPLVRDSAMPAPSIDRLLLSIMWSCRSAVQALERIADAMEAMQKAQAEALTQALIDEIGRDGDPPEPEHTMDG